MTSKLIPSEMARRWFGDERRMKDGRKTEGRRKKGDSETEARQKQDSSETEARQ